MPALPGWSSLGHADLLVVKFAVALSAALLLAARLTSQRRVQAFLSPRRADIALICLAIVAFAAWWNLGRFHYSNYWHRHEFFHYFLATKYSSELGYTRLYDCVALAEREDAFNRELFTRWTRDLRTNEIVAGAPALRDPSLCRPFFSDARWGEFKADVAWFRTTVSDSKWAQMQRDHGYNGTPVWTVIGHLLANTGPASDARILALALLDPSLLIVMWAAVWWGFGWRVMAVAMIWWGTNYPANFTYIGGGFLRADWLALAVVGIVLAKRGHFVMSGLAFGGSTLLRIFPAFAAAGLLARGLPGGRTEVRRALQPTIRFTAAAALTGLVLVPASGVFVGGSLRGAVEIWEAFAANSRKHLSGYSTNRVGLKTIVAYDPDSRYVDVGATYYLDSPGDTWQAARHRVFGQRRFVYWGLALAFLAIFAVAVRGQPEWAALVIGIGLIPILTNITCYYYGIFLAYAFLWPRHPWIAVGLCTLAAYTGLMSLLPSQEDVYAGISLGVVLFSFAVTGRLAWLNHLETRKARVQPTLAG